MFSTKYLKSILSITIFFLTLSNIHSQSSHYWSQHYGTRSMLLSGSVVGGVEDLGAVYYNPARLSQVENPAFLLSASVYQWTNVKIKDAFGIDRNTSRSDFKGVPSLAAGTFKLKFLKNHHFAYAILLRRDKDFTIGFKDEEFGDLIDTSPGEEYFGADVNFLVKAKNEWMGLSWSYSFTPKFSVGVSGFLSLENQQKSSDIKLQALSSLGDVAQYRFLKSFRFEQYGLLAKIGLSYKLKNSILGLTINTPELNLRGNGNFNYEEYLSGVPDIEDIYTSNNQENLNVTTKKPLSIGLGITFPLLNGKIHISGEWFNRIPQYSILRIQEFASRSHPDQVFNFSLIDQQKSVINAGIGGELYFSKKVSGFASFSTDFSAVPDNTISFLNNEDAASNSTTKMDFYHFGTGIILAFKGADITLGATYTGAEQNFARPIDFPDGNGGDVVYSNETSKLKINRWRFVFSFSVPFLKDYAKKWEQKFKGKQEDEEQNEN